MAKDYWCRHNDRLDPETEHVEIYRNLSQHDFWWDVMQSLSLALFRTYAVPSIGELLDATAEFTDRRQQRYDDTVLLLEAPLLHGFDSTEGRTALRRINRMHRSYDISDDDMRYVLSTFVVVPKRWIDDFGWRPLSEVELRASVNYYRTLGARMAIPDVPTTYDAFAELMDAYEAAHFAYSPGSRRVADALVELATTFYPRPLRRGVALFTIAMLDAPCARRSGTTTRARSSGTVRGRRSGHAPGCCGTRRRGTDPDWCRTSPACAAIPTGSTWRRSGRSRGRRARAGARCRTGGRRTCRAGPGGYREGMSTDPDDRTPDHDQDAEPPTPDGEEPDIQQLDPDIAAPASDPDPAPEDV